MRVKSLKWRISITRDSLDLNRQTKYLALLSCKNYMMINNNFREGCSGLSMADNDCSSSKVNPITILVPNIKLETNNCNFN